MDRVEKIAMICVQLLVGIIGTLYLTGVFSQSMGTMSTKLAGIMAFLGYASALMGTVSLVKNRNK